VFHLDHCRNERARCLTENCSTPIPQLNCSGSPNAGVPFKTIILPPRHLGKSLQLSLKAVELYEKMKSSARVDRPQSMFSSNSTASEVMLPGDTPEAPPIRIFCKHSVHQKQELEGAMMAAKFYPYVQLPRLARSGELLCPYSEGSTESELRFSFIRGGSSNANTA